MEQAMTKHDDVRGELADVMERATRVYDDT